MIRLPAAGILVAGLVIPDCAAACDCIPPSIGVSMVPSSGCGVPRNAQPQVLLDVPRGQSPEQAVQWLGPLSLVCVGPDGGRQSLDVAVESTFAYQSARLEVIARSGLPQAKDCLLLASAADEFEPETQRPRFRWGDRPRQIGWFSVTTSTDQSSPTFSGMRGPGRVRVQPIAHSECRDGSAEAWLPLHPPNDDQSEPEQMLLEVWFVNAKDALDPSRTPTAWLRPSLRGGEYGFGVSLMGGDLCRPGGNVPFPTLGERVRIGMRIIDGAGRPSAVREALLDGTPTPWQFLSLGKTAALLPAPQLLPVEPPGLARAHRRTGKLVLWVVCGALLLTLGVVSLELYQRHSR